MVIELCLLTALKVACILLHVRGPAVSFDTRIPVTVNRFALSKADDDSSNIHYELDAYNSP